MGEFYNQLTIKTNIDKDVLADFVMEFFEAVEYADDGLIIRAEEPLDDFIYGLDEYLSSYQTSIDSTATLTYELTQHKNQDWEEQYKNSVQPVEAGLFYIRPTWHEPKEGKIDIIINPSFAFGSGHHESTSMVLEQISKYAKAGKSMLDVGCGSGILSIAGSKLDMEVELCDTDEASIKNSIENFELNHQSFNQIWLGSAMETTKTYDIVVANIIADVLVMLSKDLKARLGEDSILIMSGIIEQGLDKVMNKFNDLQLIDKIQKGEWYSLVYKKGR